jgi:hypothetical protein
MMKKRYFLHHLLAERDKFERLLNQLGFSRQITMSGVAGQWSAKDIIAHVMSYEQYIADRIAEIAHDEAYTPAQTHAALDVFLEKFGYPDFGSTLLNDHGANVWIVEKYKNISLDEIVAHEIQAFGAIVSGVEMLSESQLNEHHFFERIASHTYEHYREHSHDIERWLASIN